MSASKAQDAALRAGEPLSHLEALELLSDLSKAVFLAEEAIEGGGGRMMGGRKNLIPDIPAVEHPAILADYDLEWLRRATYGLHSLSRVVAALSVAAVDADDDAVEVSGYLYEGLHMALVALADEVCGRVCKAVEGPPSAEDVAHLAYGWGKSGIFRQHYEREAAQTDG